MKSGNVWRLCAVTFGLLLVVAVICIAIERTVYIVAMLWLLAVLAAVGMISVLLVISFRRNASKPGRGFDVVRDEPDAEKRR